jgi:hypothetical protein
VQTHHLDDVDEIRAMDFLKIDVQCFELTVFQNGRNKLAEAVALQVELPFVKTYENQPTFGEIDIELQSLGFVPHFAVTTFVRMIAPMLPIAQGHGGLRQIHEIDLLYVRNFARLELMSDEQLKHHCWRIIVSARLIWPIGVFLHLRSVAACLCMLANTISVC